MPNVVVVGGFLGAGKTSLILHAAVQLRKRGLKVGVVMNDQSSDLVDTRLAAALGFPVGEVAGGCFCCRFRDLMSEFERIASPADMDVLFAEPVGSCTDIIATVIRPLNMLPGSPFTTAPFTVVIDPSRDLTQMNELVGYLFRQQLREADIVVVTKSDLFPDGVALAKTQYAGVIPERSVLGVSSTTGAGVELWLSAVLGQTIDEHTSLSLDYEKYAKAEASLGWLNLTAKWRADNAVATLTLAEPLLAGLQKCLRSAHLKAAHVKMILSSEGSFTKGGFTSNDSPLVWDSSDLDIPCSAGTLILNARVEGMADRLSTVVKDTLEDAAVRLGVSIAVDGMNSFSPEPPRPTYRLDRRGIAIPLDELHRD